VFHLAIAAYEILTSTAKAAATAYTHINVAIVTRSHFGNAKPKCQLLANY